MTVFHQLQLPPTWRCLPATSRRMAVPMRMCLCLGALVCVLSGQRITAYDLNGDYAAIFFTYESGTIYSGQLWIDGKPEIAFSHLTYSTIEKMEPVALSHARAKQELSGLDRLLKAQDENSDLQWEMSIDGQMVQSVRVEMSIDGGKVNKIVVRPTRALRQHMRDLVRLSGVKLAGD